MTHFLRGPDKDDRSPANAFQTLQSMIHDHTVFVLGAGASRPYFFPTAGELREMILQRNEPKDVLNNMGFGTRPADDETEARHQFRFWMMEQLRLINAQKGAVIAFRERFLKSELYSIDSFIAKNATYQKQELRTVRVLDHALDERGHGLVSEMAFELIPGADLAA